MGETKTKQKTGTYNRLYITSTSSQIISYHSESMPAPDKTVFKRAHGKLMLWSFWITLPWAGGNFGLPWLTASTTNGCLSEEEWWDGARHQTDQKAVLISAPAVPSGSNCLSLPMSLVTQDTLRLWSIGHTDGKFGQTTMLLIHVLAASSGKFTSNFSNQDDPWGEMTLYQMAVVIRHRLSCL